MPQCNCGVIFTADHMQAMICHMDGFPTVHHNEIYEITATLLMKSSYIAPNQLFNHSVERVYTVSIPIANTDDGT